MSAMQTLWQKILDILRLSRLENRWRKLARALAVVVVFCTTYMLILPAITMETETFCGLEEHSHSEACYGEKTVLICSFPESYSKEEMSEAVSAESHIHTDECYATEQTLICNTQEHIHNEFCYEENYESAHTHSEECYKEDGLLVCTEWAKLNPWHLDWESDEFKEKAVNLVTYLISLIPAYEEVDATLAEYEEAGKNDEYEAYYKNVHALVEKAWVNYENLLIELREEVPNQQVLFDFEWMYLSSFLSITETRTVEFVNYYDSASANKSILVYGKSVGEASTFGFHWWYAVVVEENSNGDLVVSSIHDYNLTNKSDLEASSANGFVLLSHGDGNIFDCSVGDEVAVNFDYTNISSGYSANGYGNVTFSTPVVNDGLHIVQSADTYDLIKVNLYDYGTNINEKYSSAPTVYPGFQQDYGTRTTMSSIAQWNFNFGNTVTADILAGINGLTTGASGINRLNKNEAGATDINKPISGEMKYTLSDNGYPVTAAGGDLEYLFSDNTYAKKQNTDNINGLFQQDAETGEYYYNSHWNHAQFDADTNTFTLYEEKISANFMMYPFGNFLPFTDIKNDCCKSSEIDADYLTFIAQRSYQKYVNGEGKNSTDEYLGLYNALNSFVSAMNSKFSNGWTAKDCTNLYFALSSILDESGNNVTLTNDKLAEIYTLDYDIPSDFYFGMDMEMSFIQPKNGMTGKTGEEELVFYFTGDDDVWIYIDGILFLDLSGIHRHVGGKIDFVRGEVSYYTLLTSTGDVSGEPYLTETFEEILERAGESTEILNDIGTFKDYTLHNFKFYYMERGSGSGVCRMNFNLPLVEDNTIAVTKEISTEDGELLKILGDPDFKFQVVKAENETDKTNELFIEANTPFKIVDSAGNWIRDSITDANGVIVLKAGETAIITVTEEMLNSQYRYYICELIDCEIAGQYGNIYVDSEIVLKEVNGIEIDGTTYDHFHSNIKDVLNGDTSFYYDNLITFSELGGLQITKVLEGAESDQSFVFDVKLDGVPLAVGAEYILIAEDGTETEMTVENEGQISIRAGESAYIEYILAGSVFTVTETTESKGNYTLRFEDNEYYTSDGNSATGTILPASTIKPIIVTAVNSERGTSVEISGTKTLSSSDGSEHSYTISLIQVTDKSGNTAVENGTQLSTEVTLAGVSGESITQDYSFSLNYYDSMMASGEYVYYYKISENIDKSLVGSTLFDEDVYVAEVSVIKNDDELTASVTAFYKNGEELSEISADFENSLIGSVSVLKQVEGEALSDHTQTDFKFEISLIYNDSALSGTYILEKTDSSGNVTESEIIFADGKATVYIKHNEKITLKGLPIYTKVTVSENAPGFYASYIVDSSQARMQGNSAETIISAGETVIQFFNYVNFILPETGGIGTYWYIIGGLLTALSSVFLLCYKTNRERRRENSKA